MFLDKEASLDRLRSDMECIRSDLETRHQQEKDAAQEKVGERQEGNNEFPIGYCLHTSHYFTLYCLCGLMPVYIKVETVKPPPPPNSPLVAVGIFLGSAVANITRSFSVSFRVTTTDSTGQKCGFSHLVCTGDMKADRNVPG